MFQFLVVNLPGEEDKFLRLANSIDQSKYAVHRIEALRGGLLPDPVCRLLTKNLWSVNNKGTLGCFISHAKAWELAAKTDGVFSVIVEDDIEIENIDALNSLVIPADLDIIFCNDRTCFPGENGLRPLDAVVPFIESHGRSVGGDGYILSPHGAKKILQYVEIDGLFSHVDLRLMAYALPFKAWDEFDGEIKRTAGIRGLKESYSLQHKLIGASLSPYICRNLYTPSRRDYEDLINATKFD
jgi:hypothetical protein